jgi:hypothetical protein
MKELDAKTKWCPMARVHVMGQSNTASNRFLYPYSEEYTPKVKCIGSGCMLWVDRSDMSDKMGYCGLVNQ